MFRHIDLYSYLLGLVTLPVVAGILFVLLVLADMLYRTIKVNGWAITLLRCVPWPVEKAIVRIWVRRWERDRLLKVLERNYRRMNSGSDKMKRRRIEMVEIQEAEIHRRESNRDH